MVDLDAHLRRYAEHLETRHPPVTVEEVIDATAQPTEQRRLPVRRVVALAVACALILLGGIALLIGALDGEQEPATPPPTPTPPERTVPRSGGDLPLGVVMALPDGIVVVPFDAPDQAIRLESDEWHEGIRWVLPDTRGGLIFEHTLTPEPWLPGTVLWLRAGATRPAPLVRPAGEVGPGVGLEANIAPFGVTTSSLGHTLFVYGADPDGAGPRVLAADLDAAGAALEITEPGEYGYWGGLAGRWPFVGGDVVAFVDWNVAGCTTVSAVSVDDGAPVPATSDCLPPVGALSHDGSTLAFFDRESLEPHIAVIDLSTGAIVDEATLDFADDVSDVVLLSSPAGWLVYEESPTQFRLRDLAGTEVHRIDKSVVPTEQWPYLHDFMVFAQATYFHPLEIAPSASLGSGVGDPPCQPTDVELPARDLPEPVESTRQLLFDLASSCDYEGLAAVAEEHGTLVSVSYHTAFAAHLLEDEMLDPRDWGGLANDWVVRGRIESEGFLRWAPEPLGHLASLLASTPVDADSAAVLPCAAFPSIDPTAVDGTIWTWPQVFLDSSDAAWEDLEQSLGDLWVAELRPLVETHGRYSEYYRVGIAPDGTWRFFVLGSRASTLLDPEDCPPERAEVDLDETTRAAGIVGPDASAEAVAETAGSI